MGSNKKQRPFKYKNYKNRPPKSGGAGGRVATLTVDVGALPADLDQEHYEQIVAELPMSRRKT